MDGFDQLPDSLILLIFNSVSDIKSLIRCRAVSKRFNFNSPANRIPLVNSRPSHLARVGIRFTPRYLP
ncbi:hypothetical protein Patl1_08503 [Pistacia atlantica]|uniref:Uncharacterized protein n=1 Tax=Pistacia atlantica TaxID=434234 RepID=A0ACC1AIS9_9ROSI|nr:hypothetical protein Patl1_08503 [Pistacia atlantica]